MKKRLAMCLLVASSIMVSGVFAQEEQHSTKPGKEHHGEKRADKVMKEMTEKLSLSKEQQEKIRPIIMETGKTMKENREKYKGNQKCMHQARFQTHKASEEKIMAVLNTDQQKKFQEEKKRRMEDRKKKREEELMKPIDCK
jgi:Spy/CpxP family protein refolding chaperone